MEYLFRQLGEKGSFTEMAKRSDVSVSYHVCRLVDWALERVCKREQKQLVAHSRMLKYNRRILMKNPKKLTESEQIKLLEILRISEDLRRTYGLRFAVRKMFKI